AAISSVNLTRCVTLSADAQSWTPKNLTPGATYYVRVRAINADGVSDWSDALEIKLPNQTEFIPLDAAVSEAFADLFAEDGEDDFWFEFEKATGARK
ncbi:MAG: fibronectin type III domain-containing protein, partial [Thermoguttaceae bacterium]|nr:fibronectin type III domain-containing protein [Thermoguttaceae bacterium]